MSGRQGEGGPTPGRSQQSSQARNSPAFGAGRGAGGRGPSNVQSQGRGIGAASGPQQSVLDTFTGTSSPAGVGSGFGPQGDGQPQRAQSAQMPTRGVTLPQGMNTFSQTRDIMFGSIATKEDGTLNNLPSPQQPDRNMTGRSPPENAKAGGRGGGRGGPRSAGARNFNKPNRGPPMQAPAGVTGSPVAFGTGLPNIAMMAYPQMNSGYHYQNYPMGQQQQYQAYQTMYQMGGFPGHQHYVPQQQYSQPQAPYARQPQLQASAFQGPTHPPRSIQAGFPENKPPSSLPMAEPRKSKALTITNPATKQPIVVDRPASGPANGSAGPRRQPSQGSPTPRPGQTPAYTGAPQSRALNILAPPAGRPSKPSAPSPQTNGQSTETSKPKESAAAQKDSAPPAAEESNTAEALPASRLKPSEETTSGAADAQKAEAAAAKNQADDRAAEEAAAKQKADEESAAEAAKMKAAKEAAAKQKADEEAAAAAKKAEEDAKAASEAAAAAKKAEEEAAAKKAKEEAAAKQKAEEEAALKQKAEEEAAAKKAQEVAHLKEQEAQAQKAEEDKAAALDTQKAAEAVSSTTSSQEEAAAPAVSASQPAKKKGKKGLNAAIAARKDAEPKQYDPRETDLSAFKSPAAAPSPVSAASREPKSVERPSPVESSKVSSPAESADEDVDWEQKEIKTPRLAAPENSAPASDKRTYSKDYLEKINSDLLACRAHESWPGLRDIEIPQLLRSAGPAAPSGRMRGPPPHVVPGNRGEDKWQQRRPPPAAVGFHPPGMLQPPPPSRGHAQMIGGRGAEADKWARNPLPPMPQQQRAPALHKSTNRYELGQTSTDNVEEEKKQRDFKSLLNKLTPEKYDVILGKLIEVGITSPLTLYGLIDQVFDKALSETVFCELYATLCQDLNSRLPEFEPEPSQEDQKKVNFRRSLVNKCQIEFEQGAAAIKAVKAREEADADAALGDAEEAKEEIEPGEIVAGDDKLAARRAALLEAQAEQKARRRALGNIAFVGHLYKCRMLTEKIMHSCIQTLLEDVDSPRAEDVECLCKLLATIGGQLEASTKSAGYMAMYCQRMESIKALPSLENRHKFMIQDILDMRNNGWRARRKVEGPKKLDEIHRDAEREQAAAHMQASRGPDRGYGGRGRGPSGFRDSQQMRQAPPLRPRHVDRLEEQPRPMQRTPSQDGFFAPGGRTTGGFRPTGNLARSQHPRDVAQSRDAPAASGAAAAPEPAPTTRPKAEGNTPQAAAGPQVAEDTVRAKSKGLLLEFAQLRSADEVRVTLTQDIPPQRADLAVAVTVWFDTAFNTKGADLVAFKEFMRLVAAEDLVPKEVLVEGVTKVLETLDDDAMDTPFAPKLVGEVLGGLISVGVISLEATGALLLKAGCSSEDFQEGESPPLVDSSRAADVVGAALSTVAALDGNEKAATQWKAAGFGLSQFLSKESKPEDATAIAAKYDISSLL